MHRSYRTRAHLEDDGKLTLNNLPFPPGTRVEVTVRAAEESTLASGTPISAEVEPVMEHEWDVLE